jgi:hypothetical protein
VDHVAKKLKCFKATSINCLRLIRQKTGIAPENLRAYSAQFRSIEQSVSDPRARRIAHRSTSEGSASEHEEL